MKLLLNLLDFSEKVVTKHHEFKCLKTWSSSVFFRFAKIRIFYIRNSFFLMRNSFSNTRNQERKPIQNFISSFVRFVALYMSPKRRNGISFLRLFVFSPSPKYDGTTKRQSYREISKFDLSWLLVRFVVCSFCRLPQGAKTTERQRDKMRFCGHFVLSFVRFVALYCNER